MRMTSGRYEQAASSLALLRGALMTGDAENALAGAFTAFGMLWNIAPRSIWEEARQIAQELAKGYEVPELQERAGTLRELLLTKAAELHEEETAEAPMVLIMVESDPDNPGDLMGGPFLICPHEDCNAEDEIKQVEVTTYLNPVRINDEHDGINVGDGSTDDSDDQGYMCGECSGVVTFPEDLEANRSYY